jgi:hypothetical protein
MNVPGRVVGFALLFGLSLGIIGLLLYGVVMLV